MKRKIVVFVLLLLLVASVIFLSSGQEYSNAISVKEFNRLEEKTQEEVSIIGKIKSISFDTFTIVDLEFPEDKLSYTFESEKISLENYSTGQLVLVTSKDGKAKNIEGININRALNHLQKRKPLLKPSKGENTSDGLLSIKLENVGVKKINYENLYDENFGYSLIYKLNDQIYPFHPIEDFDTIAPKESIEVGFPISLNMISEMETGENLITFIWGQKSLYDEDFKILFQSEPIEIILE